MAHDKYWYLPKNPKPLKLDAATTQTVDNTDEIKEAINTRPPTRIRRCSSCGRRRIKTK